MPCYTDPPTRAEMEAGRLRELMHEVNGNKFDHKHAGCGNPREVQTFTRILCEACKAIDAQGRMGAYSLELQLWWRDHQEQDARHEREQREAAAREEAKQRAMAKLTPEERAALGLRD